MNVETLSTYHSCHQLIVELATEKKGNRVKHLKRNDIVTGTLGNEVLLSFQQPQSKLIRNPSSEGRIYLNTLGSVISEVFHRVGGGGFLRFFTGLTNK